MPFRPERWRPTTIERFIGNRPTSTEVLIVDTDCGEGFLKALGNATGPHALACELIGSLAADWLGLPKLDFALVSVSEEDELRFASGHLVLPGPAFISKRANGYSWGGDDASLERVSNREDLTRLPIFDTWVRNCDRQSRANGRIRENLDNVFFTAETGGRLQLVAMDHTHVFTCGRDLSARLSHIDIVKDQSRYGLFPAFEAHWNLISASDALGRLVALDRQTITGFVEVVPREWQVDDSARRALVEFLVNRAHWLGSQNAASWMTGAEAE